jgi:hypothetical protein
LVRCAVKGIRRKEPLHALDISGRCPIALIHVTATNPLRAGRHTYLVTRAVIADSSAGGVRAVEEIIARSLRIVAARITNAVVDRIVPIVIVIAVRPIPAAVVRLQRVVRPTNAGIGAGNNNVLPGVTKRPYLRGMGVLDSRFDRGRTLG